MAATALGIAHKLEVCIFSEAAWTATSRMLLKHAAGHCVATISSGGRVRAITHHMCSVNKVLSKH